MQPGDLLCERYRLLRLLDVGGMGEVWAAKNELTQKSFAIKFLLPALAERPDALARFVREAETAGRLDHPCIVDVFDVAQTEDGRAFIVMELLSGESLESRLERVGSLRPMEAAAVVSQVAAGLDAAHRAGIVHRDLSLANVFLARNPEGGRPIPKILDFGVSKTLDPVPGELRTGEGTILGCPDFMSPEQAMGAEAVDARTDVWSLGVVLYRCLAGTAPFVAKNYNALMAAILTRPHRPITEVVPSVDPDLAAVVEGCLVKEREQRIQSAHEVSERLSAIARRLSKSTNVSYAPRRRATDRLPASPSTAGAAVSISATAVTVAMPPSHSGSESAAALSDTELHAVARLRTRPAVVGMVSALVGIGIGALLTIGLRPPRNPIMVPTPAMEPASVAAPEPESAETPAPTRAARPADDERDLALAVARGVRASAKPRRR